MGVKHQISPLWLCDVIADRAVQWGVHAVLQVGNPLRVHLFRKCRRRYKSDLRSRYPVATLDIWECARECVCLCA